MLIIGRSHHPYMQFLGDIISSGFDADKLDYLLRDAIAAGYRFVTISNATYTPFISRRVKSQMRSRSLRACTDY